MKDQQQRIHEAATIVGKSGKKIPQFGLLVQDPEVNVGESN